MTEASETLPDLEQSFTIRVNGADFEVEMKFALLRELTRSFPNPGDPQAAFHQPHLFELALTQLLIPRNEKGRPIDEDWDLDEIEVDPAESIALVKWAMEHVIRFFLIKLGTMTNLGESNRDRIEALLSSLPGLTALASKKASAGPTDLSDLISAASTGE